MPAAPARPKSLAPGARVVIRDEEWSVRQVRSASEGGQAVHATGVSELVRGREGIFLTGLDEVRELKPEEARLIHDTTPRYRRSRLWIESLLRRSPPTDTALHIGHRGAIDPADYQLEPAAKALRQLRPRLLLADGVGLGKTIEAGVILAELIQRGRGDRILVVALRSMLEQLQKELWARFAIPLVRLDSTGIDRIKWRIPQGMNPFHHYDRVIVSIDTLKDRQYLGYLESARWDAVLIDECQNVALRGKRSQRSRLAQLLARQSEALLLTSATPHDGTPGSFASIVQLLDPTAIADRESYTAEEVRGFYLRRFKKDVEHEVRASFREREGELLRVAASPAEDAVFAALEGLVLESVDRGRGKAQALFRTLLLKAFLSSPAACLESIDRRLETLEPASPDRERLLALRERVAAVGLDGFTKYRRFLEHLRAVGIGRKGSSERVVVFSERLATLRFLRERLEGDLGLGQGAIAVFDGTMLDVDQQDLVRRFGIEKTPLRVLLASDVASEGLNLHYQCARLVHFDLPWSLITLEQRNGRIDRYGQTRTPRITHLLTTPGPAKSQGDLRILELLIQREEAAHRNLGDVAWLLGLHDAEREEARIALAIERGEAPERVLPERPPADFLAAIFGDSAAGTIPVERRDPVRLFGEDLHFVRAAVQETLDDAQEHVEWHDHLDGLTLRPPADLERRLEFLPPELNPDGKGLKLTVDRARVMAALAASRKSEGLWPEWQLLWDLHPAVQWLSDRVLAAYRRHEAPVLRVAHGLAFDERVFLFQGVVSNRRSQPVLVSWFGVRLRRGRVESTIPLDALIAGTKLGEGPPNPGGELGEGVIESLESLRAPAVEAARAHVEGLRRERAEALARPLREGLKDLVAWEARALAARDRNRWPAEDIRATVAARSEWIEQGLRTVPEPYLRLAAVLLPQEAG